MDAQIKTFHENDPDMAAYRGNGFLFFRYKDDGKIWGYDIERLNNTFEDALETVPHLEKNLDRDECETQKALISLMIDLMACHEQHSGNPAAWMETYEGIGEDYLSHYEKLLSGLSESALGVIACHKKPAWDESPFRTGERFARLLRNERQNPGVKNQPAAQASAQNLHVWDPDFC